MKDSRLESVIKLCKLFKDKVSLSMLLSPKDTPLTKEICYGVTRHYFKLETILNYLLKKKPSKIEIHVILLTGIYQLQYLNMPDYAVVKESVNILVKLKMPWAKGLVNAVLRNFCRRKEFLLTELAKDCPYNHPKWLLDKLKEFYPNNFEKIISANDTHPPLTLRVNKQKITEDSYLKKLEDNNIKAHKLTYGIEVKVPMNVNELPGFESGEVSVQDEAAQLAVSLLQLQPGLRVLDACSAPGGKLCHILETETNLKDCIALEIDANRIQKIEQNLKRLNLAAKIIHTDAIQSDWWDKQPFDRILLDAPCSATGVIRRHPDIKILRTPKDVTEITLVQKQLLDSLWTKLGVKGILVYATCSVLYEENEKQIKDFLTRHTNAKIVPFTLPWGHSDEFGYQILPFQHNTDGFFYSVLQKI